MTKTPVSSFEEITDGEIFVNLRELDAHVRVIIDARDRGVIGLIRKKILEALDEVNSKMLNPIKKEEEEE